MSLGAGRFGLGIRLCSNLIDGLTIGRGFASCLFDIVVSSVAGNGYVFTMPDWTFYQIFS